jgi:hypothetical protein
LDQNSNFNTLSFVPSLLQALLTIFPRFRGTTIIESPRPFTVPHIIISESPPQHPYVEWYNSVSKPQDERFLSIFDSPQPILMLCMEEDQEQGVEDVGSSCPNTPALMSDEEEDGEEYGEEYEEGEYEEDDDEREEELAEAYGDILSTGEKIHRPSCNPFRNFENADHEMGREGEDEDDLPPLDEWYQVILNRTRQ